MINRKVHIVKRKNGCKMMPIGFHLPKKFWEVRITGCGKAVKTNWDALKGLLLQILGGLFLPTWISLDLKGNLYWFLKFSVVSSILHTYQFEVYEAVKGTVSRKITGVKSGIN